MSFDWLSQAEREEFLSFMEGRFGMAPETFDGYALFRRGEFINALALSAVEAANALDGEDGGLPLTRVTHSGHHKPVTRGVQTFGWAATRNVLAITEQDIRSLVEGRRVEAAGYQGFVILKCGATPIGVGLCREGKLESQLPRSMTEHLVLFAAGNLV